MSGATVTRRPMSLQTRLMTAVIGFVSLILVIVAVITSATLGSTLEDQLDNKVKSYAATIRDRDTMTQDRVPIDNVKRVILDRMVAARG